jgi:hypothetical protein
MPELNIAELKKRYKRCEREKEEWRSIYEEAYEYALPMRNLYDGYFESKVVGQNKMKRVFDSTAIHSTSRFANRVQSSLFPPQRPWCRLEPGEEIPEQNKIEVQQTLDFYTSKMFGVMAQSGFDLAIGEFLLDLCVGTACLLIQRGTDEAPIRYTAVPSYQICFEEGPNGTVDTVYRKLMRPFNVIEREFPGAEMPQELIKKYEMDPTEKIALLESTYTNDGYMYYCLSTMEGDHKLLSRELKSFPWVISRYMTCSGEKMGRGPILYALADIKTLNKVIELTLKNASISIGGVYTAVDDGVINAQSISIVPGAIIGVSSNGGPRGPSLTPLPRSGDPQLSQIVANDLRSNIKQTLLDESLPPDNMSARSATEIVERMKQLSQHLGSAYGRMIQEAMYPIVRRTLELMDELGMIELPLKVNGLQVNVKAISPLAMASNMDKVNNVMQYMQIAQSLGPVGQTLINMERAGDFIADQLGVPAALRTTPDERAQIQQQMMQAAQMAMQQQQQEMEGPVEQEQVAAE